MTTFTNALRYLPHGPCESRSGNSLNGKTWAPDAAATESMLMVGLSVFLAGTVSVVLFGLGQVVAFH